MDENESLSLKVREHKPKTIQIIKLVLKTIRNFNKIDS